MSGLKLLQKRFNEKFKMSEQLQKHTYINELVRLWAKAEEIQNKESREIKAGYRDILGVCPLGINTAEKSVVWLTIVNLSLNAIRKFRKCLEGFFNLA